jgi:hypothetical protein
MPEGTGRAAPTDPAELGIWVLPTRAHVRALLLHHGDYSDSAIG